SEAFVVADGGCCLIIHSISLPDEGVARMGLFPVAGARMGVRRRSLGSSASARGTVLLFAGNVQGRALHGLGWPSRDLCCRSRVQRANPVSRFCCLVAGTFNSHRVMGGCGYS